MIPEYRPPEWREQIRRALESGEDGIDAAMDWAYDLGIDAQLEYKRLENQHLARLRAAATTGSSATTTEIHWTDLETDEEDR